MEFGRVLENRRSVRAFLPDALSEEQIERLLEAARLAPVGSAMYRDVHITVVRDQDKLMKLCEAAWKRFSSVEVVREIAGEADTDPEAGVHQPNLFYGAPVVFFLSHRRQTLQPGIEWANVTAIVHQMHLAAVDMGLGSCYMWGALESMRMFPELDHTALLELPEDFEPLLGLAVGYGADTPKTPRPRREIGVNYV
ncbi:MAG: nitroreductase family protein [Oscillospiraceae bacterium]|nr:nitroreductase family protein [Oscillospiraceae bacterium]